MFFDQCQVRLVLARLLVTRDLQLFHLYVLRQLPRLQLDLLRHQLHRLLLLAELCEKLLVAGDQFQSLVEKQVVQVELHLLQLLHSLEQLLLCFLVPLSLPLSLSFRLEELRRQELDLFLQNDPLFLQIRFAAQLLVFVLFFTQDKLGQISRIILAFRPLLRRLLCRPRFRAEAKFGRGAHTLQLSVLLRDSLLQEAGLRLEAERLCAIIEELDPQSTVLCFEFGYLRAEPVVVPFNLMHPCHFRSQRLQRLQHI